MQSTQRVLCTRTGRVYHVHCTLRTAVFFFFKFFSHEFKITARHDCNRNNSSNSKNNNNTRFAVNPRYSTGAVDF